MLMYFTRKITETIPRYRALSVTRPIQHKVPLLAKGTRPNFRVLIPTTLSRVKYLHLQLENLTKMYSSKVPITIVCNEWHPLLEDVKTLFPNVELLLDENFLSSLSPSIDRFPLHRRNWIRQQCIKLEFVHHSKEPVLVLDSDTFLTAPIDFIANQKTQLFVRSDVHFPYQHSLRRYRRMPYLDLSFVTHFQLMKPDFIHEIFPGDFYVSLDRWILSSFSTREVSPISEFQTMGQSAYFFTPLEIELIEYSYYDWNINSKPLTMQEIEALSARYLSITIAREDLLREASKVIKVEESEFGR